MNKESFLRCLQACIMLYEGNQPYWIQSQLSLNAEEMQKIMKLFRELRFIPNLEIQLNTQEAQENV